MSSNDRYDGFESTRSRTIRFDMSEEADEKDQAEAEEAEDDDQSVPNSSGLLPNSAPGGIRMTLRRNMGIHGDLRRLI